MASSAESANTSPSSQRSTTEGLLGAAGIDDTIRQSVQETSHGDPEEDAKVEQVIRGSVSQLQRQRQEAADRQADKNSLRKAMESSEAEAREYASEALKHEEQLKRVIRQSLREHRQKGSDSEWDSDVGLTDEQDQEEIEFVRCRSESKSEKMSEKAAAVGGGSSGAQPPPSYNQGHLAGITKRELEAQQQVQCGGKSAQQKTEEEV